MMSSPIVQHVSECFIKPLFPIQESNQICNLTTWDISMLSMNYLQKGLLFKKPPNNQQQDFIHNLLNNLKHSLSLTLFHFHPLSGHLVTHKSQHPQSYSVIIDCSNNNNPGTKFIYATLNMSISDILTPIHVPTVVKSFFDLNKAINHDGHTKPLLSIQVTELTDGVFLGCSMNHSIADGASFWNFLNTWSQIFQSQQKFHNHESSHDVSISQIPFHNRWFPQNYNQPINLPFKHHSEFISKYESPKLTERFFHFSAESIAKLKSKANKESKTKTNQISSFQSLSAFVWRSITRARGLAREQKTSCKLAINNRQRLKPPLPENYFGNSINTISSEITSVEELLENDLGYAAWKIHETVEKHDDVEVRKIVKEWLESPIVFDLDRDFDSLSVVMISSPRFDMYGNEFGMGKAVAVLSGGANKCDGCVTAYEGCDGVGSVDLEICLSTNAMRSLELDQSFMDFVSDKTRHHEHVICV